MPGRWSEGPSFLKLSSAHWPKRPNQPQSEELPELKSLTICCLTTVESDHNCPDATQFSTWKELVEATRRLCQKVMDDSADTHREAELVLLRECQAQSFPEEIAALKTQKPIPHHSRLACLAPE